MNIIQKQPNPSGAYSAPLPWYGSTPLNGCAIIPDSVDMTDFYAYNGFVTLTIEEDTVTGYMPNVEAWEAWKASLTEPEPQEPEPTTEERITALEEQLLLTDETAVELYEMQLAQEEINIAQDTALIELYEMLGGE